MPRIANDSKYALLYFALLTTKWEVRREKQIFRAKQAAKEAAEKLAKLKR